MNQQDQKPTKNCPLCCDNEDLRYLECCDKPACPICIGKVFKYAQTNETSPLCPFCRRVINTPLNQIESLPKQRRNDDTQEALTSSEERHDRARSSATKEFSSIRSPSLERLSEMLEQCKVEENYAEAIPILLAHLEMAEESDKLLALINLTFCYLKKKLIDEAKQACQEMRSSLDYALLFCQQWNDYQDHEIVFRQILHLFLEINENEYAELLIETWVHVLIKCHAGENLLWKLYDFRESFRQFFKANAETSVESLLNKEESVLRIMQFVEEIVSKCRDNDDIINQKRVTIGVWYALVGEYYDVAGNFNKAIAFYVVATRDYYEKALAGEYSFKIEFFKDFADTLAKLAYMLMKTGDVQEAENKIIQAIGTYRILLLGEMTSEITNNISENLVRASYFLGRIQPNKPL